MLHYISPLPSKHYSQQFPRIISILGCTGSIGVNSLRVLESLQKTNPNQFTVFALAAGRNAALLVEQALQWRPKYLVVLDETVANTAKQLLDSAKRQNGTEKYAPEILVGEAGYTYIAQVPEVTTVLSAQVGAAGLAATVAAAMAGKVVCLANKESLVLAGHLLRAICQHTGASLLPVDSEHHAIFQLVQGRAPQSIKNLLLTASGGPFFGKDAEFLATVTPQMALKHPNWSMGAKISIDSATLMNKGLEVIEAFHLYGVEPDAIDVVVHRESIIHSLIELEDNSLLAHLGTPDMRIPISGCLAWPHCPNVDVAPLKLAQVKQLTFHEPDATTFICLKLAIKTISGNSKYAIALNGANEVAVEAFLQGKCSFLQIGRIVEKVIELFDTEAEYILPTTITEQTVAESLQHIFALDAQARQHAITCVG